MNMKIIKAPANRVLWATGGLAVVMLLAMLVVAAQSASGSNTNAVQAQELDEVSFYNVSAADMPFGEFPSEAVCNPGDTVTGGGYAGPPGMLVFQSQPVGSDRWSVGAVDLIGGQGRVFHAVAVCARVDDGDEEEDDG